MRTINYELQGKEVPAALVGKVVKLRVPETYKEAEGMTKGGEADVVAKFADGVVIAIQGALRTKSKKQDLATLQKFADEYVYTVRAEGTGVGGKPKTAKGRAESIARTSGNKLFDRLAGEVASGNSANLDRLVKQGFVDRAEFDAYTEARKEAEAEAKTPKPAPAAAATK